MRGRTMGMLPVENGGAPSFDCGAAQIVRDEPTKTFVNSF